MADNTTLNIGSGGDVIAADDIGPGVKYQRVKVDWGADGVANDADDADGKRLPVKVAMAGTATRTTVADSATAVDLLASNANRKSAIIKNTSSAVLYVGLGTVAPTTSDYSETLVQGQSWLIPTIYTGVIKGIWDTDPNDGGALVTELT